MSLRETYVLPDILPCFDRAESDIHFYAHAARAHDSRAMISFTENALSIILSGRKGLYHGVSGHEFESGEALFFQAGHCLSTDMKAGGLPYRSLLIFFSTTRIQAFMKAQGISLSPVSGEDQRFKNFKAPQELMHAADTLWHTQGLSDLSPRRRELKLEDIWHLLLESGGSGLFSLFTVPQHNGPQVRLRQVVEAHWEKDLSLEELAFLCHMSLSTFKRHFQAAYGVSPGQWLQVRRLNLAAHLLKVERRAASDIYMDVGYSTPSAFTQSFKNHFGMTPKVYQNCVE